MERKLQKKNKKENAAMWRKRQEIILCGIVWDNFNFLNVQSDGEKNV